MTTHPFYHILTLSINNELADHLAEGTKFGVGKYEDDEEENEEDETPIN